MLSLSRKQLLALETVIDVAVHARPHPVQARDITKRQNVPQRYLEQVMQALVRGDILRGVRGPKGGYKLARERRRIKAGDIVRVIAELEKQQAQQQEQDNPKTCIGAGYTSKLRGELQDNILNWLDDTSVAELCENVHTENKQAEANVDFTI